MLRFWYISIGDSKACEQVLQAAGELGVEMELRVIDREVEDRVRRKTLQNLVRQAEAEKVDAIICRGRTELTLREDGEHATIPVVSVQFLGSSTFSLLADVKRRHPEEFDHPLTKAAVFSYKPVILDEESIRFFTNTQLKNVVLDQLDDQYVERMLKKTAEEGIHFCMAGLHVTRIAQKLGISCYFNPDNDGYESIYRAIQQAIALVENLSAQKERNKELESIMDYSFEAVIQVNPEGRVVFCNSIAEELLQEPKGALMSRMVWELIPELDQRQMNNVLRQGQYIYGNVVKVHECIAVINIIPYMKNGEINGAIVHLNQKERVENLEGQIKKEIYSRGLVAKYTFSDILGRSEVMEECRYKARQFAKHHANVLIFGETGTGKELFAQSIHNYSMRKDQPFVAINCGALPVNLLESELFGYVGGAFTGAAKQGKKGLLELADKGTIFLDEISEMDLQGQVRLLRVIEERVITKVGDDRVIPVDVRIIAASNKNLRKLVSEGKFREDLYYRINVLTLNIPPLRQRQDDIRLLTAKFLREYGRTASKSLYLTVEAEELMVRYPWQGNVRQLRNFCERLAIISSRKEINRELIRSQLEEVYQEEPEQIRAMLGAEKGDLLTEGAEEEIRIRRALKESGGNRSKAARILGMGRSSLWRKMKKYKMDGPDDAQ